MGIAELKMRPAVLHRKHPKEIPKEGWDRDRVTEGAL